MEIQNNQKTGNKMAILSPHLSVGTINIKGLHSLLKRHRMPVWIKKQEANICCLQETHLSPKDKQVKSEGKEDDAPGKWQPKENGCSYTHIKQNRFQA